MSRLGRAFGTGRSSFRLLAWLVAVSMCVGLATGIPIGWAAAPPASIPNEAPVEVVHIVVASQDLDSGRRLTETDVFLVPWPADMVVETWATDIDSVIDTRAIVPISRGMPISMNMLERETVPKWGVTATPKGTP
jgi:Flp pilus assembly protein CpaB